MSQVPVDGRCTFLLPLLLLLQLQPPQHEADQEEEKRLRVVSLTTAHFCRSEACQKRQDEGSQQQRGNKHAE